MRHAAASLAAALALTWAGCRDQNPPPGAIERPAIDPAALFTPDDCSRQVREIQDLLRGKPEERAEHLREVLRLAAMYDRVKAAGVAAGTVESSCGKPLRELSQELALMLHKRAQRQKDDRLRPIVEELYRTYLDRFPDDRRASEFGFFHGELLWTMERWREAAERYQWVAERDPGGKYAKESAYASLLAWKNVLDPGDSVTARNDTDAGLAPVPLSSDERKLLAAMDRYLTLVPDAANRTQLEYRKGRLHYDHNQFAEAIPLFQAVVERAPEHELAVYSANLVLDSLNIQGRSQELARRVDGYLSTPALMKDPEFARQLKAIKADLARRARGGRTRAP
jgi:hypothetical protein